MLGIHGFCERPGQDDNGCDGNRDSRAANEQNTLCSTIHYRIPATTRALDQVLVMTLVALAMQKVHRRLHRAMSASECHPEDICSHRVLLSLSLNGHSPI
jgi:hypothetical protein